MSTTTKCIKCDHCKSDVIIQYCELIQTYKIENSDHSILAITDDGFRQFKVSESIDDESDRIIATLLNGFAIISEQLEHYKTTTIPCDNFEKDKVNLSVMLACNIYLQKPFENNQKNNHSQKVFDLRLLNNSDDQNDLALLHILGAQNDDESHEK